ncbi:hypothetical protein OOZ15_09740 [Galbibacter sp. EGI 63066]|nr:hypothetical protein [Galbibacter sp. EGI 63066]MCX2680219.1 hypothetical protein [Galbibacter sp. EGI 63066]
MRNYIIWIVILAILFIAVWLNNKRNMKKWRDRRHTRFEDRYTNKKNKK